ncbi:hypothetical protein K5I29_11205 [Flavobacterium agricola]|uniref:Uncharacterized protein n=1 Tax=Flavobacterium agricola TaxID=2870839 RepID=A0ABY6M0V1_9FLAO|nr:hypothetical protein [Flavobacterium agricola]UYW01045.1 hypothetical protein K5I29_11205 [Flavobacterium agricola]
MKHIFTIAICTLLAVGCASNKPTSQHEQIAKNVQALPTVLEVQTVTRGFYNQAVIANGSVLLKKNKEDAGVSRTLTEQELIDLTQAYNAFELEKLNDYVSDSNLRAVDASTLTVIKITNNGDMFISNDFDTVNPPAELKPLVNRVQQLFNE